MTKKDKREFNLKIKNPRTRYGCDICHEGHPTEFFIGLNGNVLWIGGKCLEKILKFKEAAK